MAVIEAQWWKRERARESEVAAIKAEYARLEQQTKALLTAVQVRTVPLAVAGSNRHVQWQLTACSMGPPECHDSAYDRVS